MKEAYLNELKKHLRKLPKKEYEDAIEYFREYLDEMSDDITKEELIKELGTPKEAAREIIANVLDKKVNEEHHDKKRRSNTLWIACLAILLSPITAPLLIVFIVLLFCIILVIAIALFCIFLFGICGLFVGGKLLFNSLLSIPYAFANSLVIAGIGLMGIGACILLCILSIYIFRYGKQLFIKTAQKVARK